MNTRKYTSADHAEATASLKLSGYAVVKGLLAPEVLAQLNEEILSRVDVEGLRALKLPGFSMGNLNMKKCFLHARIWDELVASGLIDLLQQEYSYQYLTCGGNLNLPGSQRQRYHRDSFNDNLIINIPLVDTSIENGAVTVVGAPNQVSLTTPRFFASGLHRQGKQVCTQAGDVILRHVSTWHRGNPNLSQAPRMMLSFILRRDFPYGDPAKFTIANPVFDGEFQIYGNIYWENRAGRVMEVLDRYIPSVGKSLQHLYMALRGR